MMEQVPEFMRSESVIALYTELYEAGLEMQQELAGLSSRGRQIMVKDSGHNIHVDQPNVVIDAIKEIVEQARQ
jgi:pimeloyl-ACP methyl ester carboxylesterase